uniref:Inner membrane protein n=1 Tax=Caenorhabditis tropicalis TaxID=1561998 RepID=A0A1I7TXD3_9PELO
MLERVFATWFIKDYEQKKRYYVAFGIILLMMLMSTLTAHIFNSKYVNGNCITSAVPINNRTVIVNEEQFEHMY